MSKLLDLVDKLIGNVLQGNLYTNNNNYISFIKTPTIPPIILNGPPINAADTRPLNISGPEPEHPHNPLVGQNPKTHIFTEPVHNVASDFAARPNPLNIQASNPHPHTGLVGQNPQQHAIPDDVVRGLHDTTNDFLNSSIPARTKRSSNSFCEKSENI